jgi:hypothetical protein
VIKGRSRHRDIHHARIETKILAMSGAMFSFVCANSQKVTTTPKKHFVVSENRRW